MAKTIKEVFLEAPEEQIDKSVFPLIELWDDDPTAIQILRVLDQIVYTGAASEFVVTALDMMLQRAIVNEGQSLDELVKQAVWRLP